MRKKALAALITLSICISAAVSSNCTVSAESSAGYSNSMPRSSVEAIAVNAASSEMGWSSVSLSNIHTIYDFNGSIIGYSVDVKNNGTKEQGYELISSSPNDEPIMEFSTDSSSPYDAVSGDSDTCIFSGICGYYAKSSANSKYYDITSKKYLTSSEVVKMKKVDKNKTYISPNKSKSQKLRSNLEASGENVTGDTSDSSNSVEATATSSKTLSVPFYVQQDNNSCSPTSAAMALRYEYPYYVPSNQVISIYKLETTMNWSAANGVTANSIPAGIISAMHYWGLSSYSSDLCFNVRSGRSYSTYALAVQNINQGWPLLINDAETSSSITYHNHTMCIVGYKSSTTKYIIVHDTWHSYNVNVNYNSSTELGSNFFYTALMK